MLSLLGHVPGSASPDLSSWPRSPCSACARVAGACARLLDRAAERRAGSQIHLRTGLPLMSASLEAQRVPVAHLHC